MNPDSHIAAVKELIKLRRKRPKEKKEPLHSIPISTEERTKREHNAEEHRRFTDAFGNYKITRNTEHYITQIRKQVEDVVVERDYERDASNYIITAETRLKIERKA